MEEKKIRVWTTKDFWLDTFERVASTGIQAALGVLATSGLIAFGAWPAILLIATAAGTSLLKSLGAALVSSNVSPASLIPASGSDEPEVEVVTAETEVVPESTEEESV